MQNPVASSLRNRPPQPPRPLVSIYIPTRNRVRLVRRAVASALGQQGVSVEVIVVDDGSTDDTRVQLESLARAQPRLRVLGHPQSEGACAARNRAIAAARGRYVTGLDDDDELRSNHVARLVARFSPALGGVCASRLEVHGALRVPNTLDAGLISLADLLHYNRVGNQLLTLTERVRAVGGFDEGLPAFQDYDLWVRLVARYGPVLRTRDVTYVQHLAHSHERISASPQRRLEGFYRFIEKHEELLQPEHRRSMELLHIKLRGDPLGLRDALRLFERRNTKTVLSMLINSHLPVLQKFYHRLRAAAAGSTDSAMRQAR